ncbi:fungal specific transcription factor [Histoplasma capsulatum H143]|uniref:Fungal specific transcription factor n=1 Tax=Ajellomyces capsulatus (strain H143) TaxID=544712 RepID=C6HFX2_AJECH|nr:fungal specific transcription factor [Histoplasma capsulatum H143]
MLSQELAQVESEISHSTDAEFMVRGAGLIKFKETDEPRFLGPSSGITITRLVMEIAKQNTNSKSIKEVVNEATAQEIKYAFTLESQKPTSKIYPMISSVAEPNLPPRELAYRLIDIFMAKVGVAVKLCQDLGLTDEATITKSPSGPLDCLELDMRRRLFWIITSMEYGLSHSLGRPSAFAVTHDHINMEFFSMVDDRFITRGGILPGGQPIMKKCIAIHFFKMRLLQAEIRRTLYLKKRDRPLDDKDPWFTTMLAKLDRWVTSCPKNDEGSGLSELWFTGRRNTMIVFMFRPSPQIPEPSLEAARRCYDASTFNIKMHKTQVATGSVDLTWVFTQSVFMALNTILWSLSYPSIRQEHTIDEVKSHIAVALDIIIGLWHR